jgi:hypothetical protein
MQTFQNTVTIARPAGEVYIVAAYVAGAAR